MTSNERYEKYIYYSHKEKIWYYKEANNPTDWIKCRQPIPKIYPNTAVTKAPPQENPKKTCGIARVFTYFDYATNQNKKDQVVTEQSSF